MTSPKIKPNQILLTFEDKEQVDYIKLVCRRKVTNLETYILDNFEWDAKLPCLSEGPLKEDCNICDFRYGCPDVAK